MKITVEFDRDWYEMLRERILPRIRSSTIDTLEEEVAAAITIVVVFVAQINVRTTHIREERLHIYIPFSFPAAPDVAVGDIDYC